MADPRNTVDLVGIGYEAQSFLIDDVAINETATEAHGSAVVGRALTLSADKTVTLVGDGELVLGKLIKVESDGVAIVQTGGYMELPGGDGATLTIGERIVGDLGAAAAEGYIRAVATGTAAELGHARGIIIDNDTTTAVVVRLEGTRGG